MKRIRRLSWILPAVLLGLGALTALAIPELSLPRQVVGAGGGSSSAAGVRLRGTIGQPVVAQASDPDASAGVRSGFWHPAAGVSAVGDELQDLGSLKPGLEGNVPNPFNPMTEIRFVAGPRPVTVRLKVYDVSGRLVRTLHDGVHPAGHGKVVWNGRDERGGEVPSGLYFARLEIGGQRFTRKMMLVR